MTGDQAGHAIRIVGSMILVGTALIVRRQRFRGRGWQMALAWVAIFAALIVAGLWIDAHRFT